MNDEQKTILNDMIKDLSGKPISELKAFYAVVWVVGAVAATAGVGVLLMSMFLPGLIMFIATGFVLFVAGQISMATDMVKYAIKGLIKTKEEG